MKEIKETLLRVLYPRRCPICHGIVASRGEVVHPSCAGRVPLIGEARCKRCGKGLEREEEEYCSDCKLGNHSFTRGLAAYAYDEIMKQSIYQMKFHNKREYADFYVRQMRRMLEPVMPTWRPQVLIPVPLHKSRYRKRGFNQSLLLAEGIGKAFSIPVRGELVERTRATLPQKELNVKKRKNNLKNAFKIKEHDVKLDRVLVIDDIYTTGSTIDAISELLLARGVKKIYFAVLCIGKAC